MVNYIIEEPLEIDSENRKFKFPFVSCELLSCNIDVILD
jgi:hypothetical protein